MIKIDFHKKFQKHYLKRVKCNKNLDNIFNEKVCLFVSDPNIGLLNSHRLVGRGDIRIIYQWIGDNRVLFLDIGSHNQIY